MNRVLFNKLYDLIKCELDIQLGDGDYIDPGDKEAATEAATEAIIEVLEKEDLINREYNVRDCEDEKEEREMALAFARSFKSLTEADKKAIEKIFNVHVKAIQTITVKPKKKRVGRYSGFTNRAKKAIVTLAEGEEIKLD